MKRALAVLYGAIAYAIFLASFLYAVAWLGNLFVPKTIDSGPPAQTIEAFLVNLLLLGAFAVQHSVMARPAFKRWFTGFVSPAVERSTFVLLASLLLFAICLFWRPLPMPIWHVEGGGAVLLWALFWLGWLIVLASTFMINHFELFGLRQVWQYARGTTAAPAPFVERLLYRFVRHPIMLGFLIAFWATPQMSAGHLFFAIVTTAYIVVALQLEESDLRAAHGASYDDYRKRVPMLLPLPWRRAG
jgi:protein-S-isoprenylcysteine O-methyltransferase Ste14